MRERVPPGVPCWVDVSAPHPPAAAAFYGRVLGSEAEDLDGKSFVARLDGHAVAGVAGGPAASNTSIGAESADAGAARVAEAGVPGFASRHPDSQGAVCSVSTYR